MLEAGQLSNQLVASYPAPNPEAVHQILKLDKKHTELLLKYQNSLSKN